MACAPSPLARAVLGCLLASILLLQAAAQDNNAQQNGGQVPEGFEDVKGFFEPEMASPPPTPFGTAAGNIIRLKYTGTGTTSYSEEPIGSTGAVGYACSFGFISPPFRANYVGLSSTFYNKGFGCGQCIKLQCDDQACKEPGKQMMAMVVDLCGDCYDADLSISTPLFQNLTGARGPSAQVSWEWTSCGDAIEGPIMMLLKPGGTAYFQAFNFANSKQPIVAVQINRQLLKRSGSGNWWEWNPGKLISEAQGFEIRLLGQNREVLTVRLPKLATANLGVQFKSSEPPKANP